MLVEPVLVQRSCLCEKWAKQDGFLRTVSVAVHVIDSVPSFRQGQGVHVGRAGVVRGLRDRAAVVDTPRNFVRVTVARNDSDGHLALRVFMADTCQQRWRVHALN